MIEIQAQGIDPIDRDFEEYPKAAQRAIVRALNRALTSGQTAMVKAMAADTGLKSGDIKKALRQRKATADQPTAVLGASTKRLPLYAFKARQTKTGVSYRLSSGRGQAPHAFIATMPTGHVGVFARRLKARLPIKELLGPSLGHVFIKYQAVGLARMQEAFSANIAHEIDYAMGQANAS